jgi:hypothetical protein
VSKLQFLLLMYRKTDEYTKSTDGPYTVDGFIKYVRQD